MFDVVLMQPLYKDSARRELGKVFYRQLQLPFPPYVGLSVNAESWSSWPIASVRWDVAKRCFFCTLEDRAPNEATSTTYDGLFDHLEQEEGWVPANKWKKHET